MFIVSVFQSSPCYIHYSIQNVIIGIGLLSSFQFWSCYVVCDYQDTDAVRVSLDQCDVIRRFVEYYPDTFQWVDSADGKYAL